MGSCQAWIHFQDYTEIVEEEEGDYSSPARDYDIDRSRVELGDIIGEGQVSSDTMTLFHIRRSFTIS